MVLSQLTYLGIILLFEKFNLGLNFLVIAVPGNQSLIFILFIFLTSRLLPGIKISIKNCSFKF